MSTNIHVIETAETTDTTETPGAAEARPPKRLTDAKKNDPRLRLLMHPELVRLVSYVLRSNRVPARDLEDGLQEVRLRVLEWFVDHELPSELHEMKSLCATIAKRWSIDRLRRNEVKKKDGDAGLTSREDRHELPRPPGKQRDPVDARRELDLASHLFREGQMPEHGIDILEGAAWDCKYKDLGNELGISAGSVEGRLRTIRRVFRRHIDERGMG